MRGVTTPNGLARSLLMGPAMKNLSWLALALVVAGCGTGPEEREERARNPVTFCAGLDRAACGAAPECYVEPLACITLCVDDGFGNCTSPCPQDFRCLARPTSCEQLDRQACDADPRCEFEHDPNFVGDPITPPNGCSVAPGRCVTRQPTSCEQLDVNACSMDQRCEVVTWACTAECRDDGHGGCLPCNAPPASCRTRQPTACAQLSDAACSADPRCELIQAVCTAQCAPDGQGGCEPCNAPSVCIERRPPQPCFGLNAQQCSTDPRCEVISYGCECDPNDFACDCANISECRPRQPTECYGLLPDACDARPDCEWAVRNHCACTDNEPACSCPVVEPSCLPRTTPSTCEQLSPQQCVNTPGCGLLEVDCACPAGVPCDCDIAPRCVTVTPPPPLPCQGLSDQECASNPRCELLPGACPAVCIDDGMGGCLPCNAPSECVEREEPPVPSHCFGLNEQACSSDPRCELVTRACTLECRDDGMGGCLPCPTESVCVPRSVPSCEQLDIATCTTDSRCELDTLVCTTECRDDGMGGCLPCPSTVVCRTRDEGPIAGCGMGGGQPPSP